MTLTNADWAEVAEELAADSTVTSTPVQRRFNVAPTQLHPIVANFTREARSIALAYWGFAGKNHGPLVINARSETAAQKPLFRDALANRRCVVVADGFLEWRKTAAGRQPLWFRRPCGGALYFAGLFTGPGVDFPARFVVLTTAANNLVAPVHDRMPAVLSPQKARLWLERPALDVLAPAPDVLLTVSPVSSRVNSPTHDDPECLVAQVSTVRQLALFS